MTGYVFHRRLVFVEVKHGDGALNGAVGLHAPIKDVNQYAGDPDKLSKVREETVRVFNQKRSLGLINRGKDLAGFSNDPPFLLLAFVNHDPGSRKLRDLLRTLPHSPNAELRIATASFLGCGLYDQGIHPLNEAWRCFGNCIHKDLPTPR